MSEIVKNRFIQVDLARAIAIVAVVIIHVSSSIFYDFDVKSPIFFNFCVFLNQISRFAVPIFIFISGFGLALSKNQTTNILEFVLTKSKKIIPLYLLWYLIYYAVFCFIFKETTFSVTNFIKNIFTGDLTYHFYFVPLIIQFYIIFRLLNQKTNLLNLAIAFVLNFILLQFNINKIFFPVWIFYFMLGIWSAKNIDIIKEKLNKYKRLINLALISIIFFITYESILYFDLGLSIKNATTTLRPTIMIFAMFFFAWILNINAIPDFLHKIISFLSKASYSIFLSHAGVTQHKLNHSYH